MTESWVRKRAIFIVAGIVIIPLILMVVLPMSPMTNLCVRRPLCVHECCPLGMKFTGEKSGFKTAELVEKIRQKMRR